jgi:hypothetical protein
VRTTVVGQLRLNESTAAPQGGCAGATHVISGVAVGAFKLLAGGSSSAGGGASVAVLGEAGAKASRSERTVREAGDPVACAAASDEGAPLNCRSPIQVFLSPLEGSAPTAGSPSTTTTAAPSPDGPRPGHVQVAFASHDPSAGWRLHDGNGTAVCDLPCERWVPREGNYALRRETGDGVDTIRLPDWDQPADRRVDARLQPGRGSKALGIVGISLGGAIIFSGLVWMLTEGVIAEEPNYLGPAILTGAGAGVLTGGIAFTIYSRRDNWLDVQVGGAP